MANVEAHEVHIETLYGKVDALAKDCADHHREGLGAIQRVHQRIDDFTKIMIQISEMNKDVQAVTAHQKALDAEVRALADRVATIKQATDSNTDTSKDIKRLGWAITIGFGGLIGATLWQIILRG